MRGDQPAVCSWKLAAGLQAVDYSRLLSGLIDFHYLSVQIHSNMATKSTKPSTFLLFPWGLLSIVLILVLSMTLDDSWFRSNWSWITLVLIIPAAILENFKVGYSTMRVMFLKVVFSLLSFLLVGMAFGSSLLVKLKEIPDMSRFVLPWYVLLALCILLLIQVAQLFSMLKAVKREFMQMDPDQ
jgi:hypothetical protein